MGAIPQIEGENMVTIKDLAEYTRISKSTISRYLNNGYVSEEKKVIIKEAIEALGYKGNSIARSLKTNKSMSIAFIVPSVTNHFFSQLAEIVQAELSKRNYRMVLYITNSDFHTEEAIIEKILADRVDGIIVSTGSKECSHMYETINVPVVSLDREISRSIPLIISNNAMGASDLTKHLHQKGCQKILFIESSNKDVVPSFYRKSGFSKYCKEHHIDYEIINDKNLNMKLSKSYIKKFDGLMIWNDQTAFYVSNILTDRGITIGKDILMTGYDNSMFSKYMNPPLTTADQPTDQIGSKTVETLLNIMEGKLTGNRKFVFHNKIIIRESTGE